MNEFWRKFDTIRFVAPWSIFKNFLGIFLSGFIFNLPQLAWEKRLCCCCLNSNLNFEFGPVSYRIKPESVQPDLTGNQSNRTGYRRFGEPWLLLVVSCTCASLHRVAVRAGFALLPRPSRCPALLLASVAAGESPSPRRHGPVPWLSWPVRLYIAFWSVGTFYSFDESL